MSFMSDKNKGIQEQWKKMFGRKFEKAAKQLNRGSSSVV